METSKKTYQSVEGIKIYKTRKYVQDEKTKQPENYVQNRKRPIFKDNYERYEWHMKNGCIGNEDRQWLSEYIRSEEFKIIYEK